jgi:PhnB protein
MKVNPYVNFSGNTEEAFNFYKSVFGGEFAAVIRFRDTPEAEKIPEAEKDKLMHIALPLTKDCVLMATDALDSMGQHLKPGNNFHLSISADSKEHADQLLTALSADGFVMMAMEQTFWGDYFGMFTDKFGLQWMISFNEAYNQ